MVAAVCSEGISSGGRVWRGTPEDVAKVKESYTGQYLKQLLGRRVSAGQSDRRRSRVAFPLPLAGRGPG